MILSCNRAFARSQGHRLVHSCCSPSIPSSVTSWIDGTFANAEASAYTNVAPRNGMELCQIVPPSPTQIQQAVASSKRAFDTEWSTTSYNERGAILTEMANCIQKHQRDLIYWEAMDTGIPITQIQINHISFAITTLRYYAAICAPWWITWSHPRHTTYWGISTIHGMDSKRTARRLCWYWSMELPIHVYDVQIGSSIGMREYHGVQTK